SRKEFDEVADVLFAQHLAQFLRHGRRAALPRLDVGLVEFQRPVLRGVQFKDAVILALNHAGVGVAVFESDNRTLEAIGDLLVGKDDRLENALTVLARANPRQIRTDFPAFTVDLVATHTRGLDLFEKYLFPLLLIAAGQAFTKRAQFVCGRPR